MISPTDYIAARALAQVAEAEMLSRLDLVALKPKRILDIGCGPGIAAQQLKIRYPEAEVIGIDHSCSMLDYAKKETMVEWRHMDAKALDFPDNSVDLIFSNLLSSEISLVEWHRVLRPEGLLMFTALGPATLQELGVAYANFIDMHHLGDSLLQNGFVDPVLDVDQYSLVYKDPQKMLHELLVTEVVPSDFILPEMQEIPPLTFEIIYAHVWGNQKSLASGVVKIPLSSLTGLKV
jgi:malonyl-CoA O-methyltransferase